MVKNPKALWDNCLSLIKENVTEQQYKTWFAPIVFEKYDEERQSVLVQVPSMYVYEYLEQYYVNLLSKALTRCFGQKVQLNYRVVTDKQHRINTVVEGEEPTSVEPAPPTNRANKAPTTLDVVDRDLNPQLDIHKTFHNYIEGDSNKLPRTVGLSIAEHPGKSTFNPFFVYGPSGCGKTHLINAIGVHCKEMYPQKRVLYVSARLFQVQFTDASRKNTVNDFINFYQSIDVLIVDDVQEWATAEKTVTTFFHIFDHLSRLGKQIILASDRPPVDLGWLPALWADVDDYILVDHAEAARKAYLANRADDADVAAFNKDTNKYNATAQNTRNLSLAQLNSGRQSAMLSGIAQGARLRQAIKDQRDAAISANLTNFAQGLGDLGKENGYYNMLGGLNEEGILKYFYGDDWKTKFNNVNV